MGAAPGGIAAADGEAPVDFGQAHAELLADSDIQFELPAVQIPPPQQSQTEYRPREATSFSGAPDAGPLAQALFWVVIGLAAAGLLYLIVSRLLGWERGGRSRKGEAEEAWQFGEEPARQLLGDADALAAEGRFSEAAHLLLHRSIEEIDRRRPASVRKALTSRDIALLPAIPPEPRSAFGSIVRAVERSLFARRPLGEQDWLECRSAYQRFAFAGAWQA
jgi:hypothetical protein